MEIIGNIMNDRYLIIQKLGEGGTSFVYQAHDQVNNRSIVIKFMKEKLTSAYIDDLIRFKREVEIISGLSHPGIIKVFGAGEFETKPYIIMELLKGYSLADRLKHQDKFTVNTAIGFIMQLAESLSYVHRYGIIHRDLKPGNIFITMEEGEAKVKLLDFGVSHIIELGEIKEPNLVSGTFRYMSPEATGILNRKVDERSDLYSLGVVFYQLITGETPFKGKDIKSILHQQVALVPVSPRKLNAEIPEILDTIIMKSLRKDPDQRYQSATGLLSDLKRYFQGETNFTVGFFDQPKKLTFQPGIIFGRAVENAKLKLFLQHAGNGKGTICLITGEAGIGKSRLVEELREDVYAQNGVFIRGRCLNHENKAPYQAFRDASDEYLSWIEKADSEIMMQEMERLRNISGDLGQILIQFNPHLGRLIGQVRPLVPLEPERENKRFLMVLASFFCHFVAMGKPVVLFLDDLQWADEGTFNLIEEIMGKIKDSNLLILATCRDQEPENLRNLERIKAKAREITFELEDIKLPPLGYEHLNKLVANILDAKEQLTPELIRYILEKSRGNPFFAIQIIRELVENKAITWRETGACEHAQAHWEYDEDILQKIPVSHSIVDFIIHRIQNLTPKQVDLLAKAAVMGREFDIQLLFKLSELKEEAIVNMVDEFITLQLLEKSAERGRLLFAHDRIRDAFYQKSEVLGRKAIHLAIANAIEDLNRQSQDKVLFELAHHYLEAGEQLKALEYVLLVANKAKISYANEEAIHYYQKAIEVLETIGGKGSSRWIAANQDLIEVYLTICRIDEAITLSRNLMASVTEPLSLARIFKKIGAAYYKSGFWDQGEENFLKSLALLGIKIPYQRAGVVSSLIKEFFIHMVHNSLPVLFRHRAGKPVREIDREIVSICIPLVWLYTLTDVYKYLNLTLRILNLSETKIGKSKELGIFLYGYASIYMAISMFNISIKFHEKALKMLTEIGDEWGITQSLEVLGHTYCWKGDYENGIYHLESAHDRYQRMGDLWQLGSIAFNISFNYRKLSNFSKSLFYASENLEINTKLENRGGVGFGQILLGLNYIETGNLSKAEELIQSGLKLTAAGTNIFYHCQAILAYGYLELEKNNYISAIQYLEHAKKIFQEKSLLKEYLLSIFPQLAEAYLLKIQNQPNGGKLSDSDLKKVRSLCIDALRRTKAWPNHYGPSLRVMAQYYSWAGKNRKAEKHYLKAIAQNEKVSRKFETAKGYLDYGKFLNSVHRRAEASSCWQKAFVIFSEIGAANYIKKCEDLGIGADEKSIGPELTTQNRLTNERRMDALISNGRLLSSILEIDRLLEKVIDSAMELTGAERGILLLYPETGPRKLEPKVTRNIETAEDSKQNLMISQSIITKVEQAKAPFIIGDALADEALKNSYSVIFSGTKSVLCAPIMAKGEMLGIIYLDNSLVSGLFDEEDLNILGLIANQAGVSIENARLWQSLEERVQERTGQLEEANRSLNQKNIELLTVNEQLKEHAAVVAELAITKERNRMATSVHDTTGHTMTLLLRLLEAGIITCIDDPYKTKETLEQAFHITQTGLTELRRSLTGLMSEGIELEARHPIDALASLFTSFQSSGMKIDLTVEGAWDGRSLTHFDVVYRTCREALTNALRHGKAQNAAIIIKFAPNMIKLYIVDDGSGCVAIKKGMGLTGMEQRIHEVGGSCIFSSDGESGFNIQVELPL